MEAYIFEGKSVPSLRSIIEKKNTGEPIHDDWDHLKTFKEKGDPEIVKKYELEDDADYRDYLFETGQLKKPASINDSPVSLVQPKPAADVGEINRESEVINTILLDFVKENQRINSEENKKTYSEDYLKNLVNESKKNTQQKLTNIVKQVLDKIILTDQVTIAGVRKAERAYNPPSALEENTYILGLRPEYLEKYKQKSNLMNMPDDYKECSIIGDMRLMQFIEDMGYDLLTNNRLYSKAHELRMAILKNQDERISPKLKKLRDELPDLIPIRNQLTAFQQTLAQGGFPTANQVFMFQRLLKSKTLIPDNLLRTLFEK